MKGSRRYPIGAETVSSGGVQFRVWAPRRRRVEVVLEPGGTVELERESAGYFSGVAPGARAGSRYRYRLDGGDAFPDPASRFQPEGPHGPSEVIDPSGFAWTDREWKGISLEGLVIYEMHTGTFTEEGTWEAARRRLPDLREVGVTTLEVMPIAEFPGRWGWGYDGVGLFAPFHHYGRPDELRQFVDEAHRLGLSVILDVVYNHVGPDGNYLTQFSEDYFTDRYKNEWGPAVNFDGENAGPVREWVITNAEYWAGEYHVDGLRLDATQQIFDASQDNIMAALTKATRAAARGRGMVVVAENEPQDSRLVMPEADGGYGLDALWNDDFHHSALVAVTGRNEAYYTDYRGKPQELISAVKHGYLYQGQWYTWQKNPRGKPALRVRREQFVNYIENHDQVANSGRGLRLHELTSPGRYRALTAFLLLAPGTPMLFQGQEFASSKPFLYFVDHNPELGKLVCDGRVEFLAQFPSLTQPEMVERFPDPCEAATFERSRLDWSERRRHAVIWEMHRDLLRLRREHPPGPMDGAVLGDEVFLLRLFESGANPRDCLLLVNFGPDLRLDPAPEPLLAPPGGHAWHLELSTEDPRYGGGGIPPLVVEGPWRIPGHSAAFLSAQTSPEEAA